MIMDGLLLTLTQKQLYDFIKQSIKDAIDETKAKEPVSNNTDVLINSKEVCSMFGITSVTLWSWRKQGKIPYHRISNKVYFKRNEVEKCLNNTGDE